VAKEDPSATPEVPHNAPPEVPEPCALSTLAQFYQWVDEVGNGSRRKAMGRSNKKWDTQACNEVMQKQDINAFHQKIEFLH
jgi:hypothetical protein